MKWMIALVVVLIAAVVAADAAEVERYETPYYIMHTDLEPDAVREAAIRMTKMAEEYYERTKEFAGQINRKLPFYLYGAPRGYFRAGGRPGSAGFFDGNRLVALANDRPGRGTWHVVQHEGFHQFASAVIGGQLPVWVNEGLAEYFGQAIFTGDGFVTGLIPPGRLKRVQQGIRENRFRPLPEMMVMTLRQWNGGLSIVNYDQGWSMVHFLAHADGGRYQGAFAAFINAIGHGKPYVPAWIDIFGRDIAAFEEKWREYWLSLPDNPTGDLYAKATAATLAGYLARAHGQKQSFDSFDDFIRAAQAGELKMHPDDWLPPSLLKEAIEQSKKVGEWSLEPGGGAGRGTRMLVCEYNEQTKWCATFTLDRNGRIGRVLVDAPGPKKTTMVAERRRVDRSTLNAAPQLNEDLPPAPPAPATRPAKVVTVDPVRSAINVARLYERNGDKAKARAAIERALKEHPDSPDATEARAALQKLK
jgi:tetratricopeptide (TPR) repeat protein